MQYYFETIFPRIPKPVHDNFVSKLTAMGLPSKAVGNAGQGGQDRRGIEEANRRPASVKASLCASHVVNCSERESSLARSLPDQPVRCVGFLCARSVAMGQRAPNRATAREEGRGLGAGMKGGTGAMGLPRTRTPERARDRDRRACVACPLGLWVLPGVIKHCLAWL